MGHAVVMNAVFQAMHTAHIFIFNVVVSLRGVLEVPKRSTTESGAGRTLQIATAVGNAKRKS